MKQDAQVGYYWYMATQRRTTRTTKKRKLSTCTAIVPTRSAAEEAWHDVQSTIRKRKQRIHILQSDIRPLEEALARFERNYRVQLGGLQDQLRILRAEVHTFQQRTERIHARMVCDPEGVMGDVFTPEELQEIGEFFNFDIPESWFAEHDEDDDGENGPGDEEDDEFDASGEGWHRIDDHETERKPVKHGEKLKSLYRSLARRFHPDLCTDEQDESFRNECMLRANAAWQQGDFDALQQLADETEHLAPDWHTWAWETRLASAQREVDRLTKQVAKLRRRLKELRTNETFPLWNSGGLGESLIATRKRSLERDIKMAQDELGEAQEAFRQAMEMWAGNKATA